VLLAPQLVPVGVVGQVPPQPSGPPPQMSVQVGVQQALLKQTWPVPQRFAEAQVEELFAPYAPWSGLAGAYALRAAPALRTGVALTC